MKQAKRKRLERAGWTIGSVQDFLGLSDQENALLEMRYQLAKSLRETRRERHLTQVDVAQLLGSSQSRVAKMESADPAVTLDLLVKANLAIGKSREDIGHLLGR